MSGTIHVRGEGGAVWEMALPLSPHIQERYDAGDIVRVNPDGTDWTGTAKRGRRKTAAATESEDEDGA